jgi:hypothetical protein
MNGLTSILLVLGVMFQSYGVNQDNLIIGIIGGVCLGIYNGIVYHNHKN